MKVVVTNNPENWIKAKPLETISKLEKKNNDNIVIKQTEWIRITEKAPPLKLNVIEI